MIVNRRTVLVTGSSRGIGRAVSDRLAEEGWTVIEPQRNDLDLSSPQSVEAFLTELGTAIDGLVLNAGVNRPEPLGEMSADAWSAIQQVNLVSSFALVSALAPRMAERRFGRIVAVSSAYASRARRGRAAYSSSKAGLESLVRTCAVEFADKGVLANCVAPGFVDTELTRSNNPPEAVAKLLERVPAARLARPAEIAGAVSFLLSPDNTYITGQTLAVDGGFSCT